MRRGADIRAISMASECQRVKLPALRQKQKRSRRRLVYDPESASNLMLTRAQEEMIWSSKHKSLPAVEAKALSTMA